MPEDRRRGPGPASPLDPGGPRPRLLGIGPDPSATLPYAPTVTPQMDAGPTHDMVSGIAPTEAPTEAPSDRTMDLPASDRVTAAGALDPGQLIGHFVIRSRLGEGGMGVVVAGYDADLGRPVAIKLVKPEVDQPAYRARLLREAQAMARLEHPNVVRVYEVGSDRGRLFVAMELVDGVTLSTWSRVQRRTWREVVALFVQVGAGLAAVHRAGLVHRDFKPDNVLVDRAGRARVADFGLARLDRAHVAASGSPELAASLTRTGALMGTPGYMAPEQQLGGEVDARADQYSYCVALREAVLGGRPRVIEGKPDDPQWRVLPRSLRAAITRGLAYDPRDRHPSMDAVLAALASAGRRRGATLAAIAAVVVVAGGAGAIAIGAAGASTPERSAATVAAGSVEPTVDAAAAPAPSSGLARPNSAGPVDAGAAPPAVADAAVRIAPDAQVARPRRGPDAGAAAPTARPDTALAPPPRPPGAGSAVPPRLPAATVGDPGHLPVVRATIRDLGYDGYDAAVTQAEVDQATGVEQGIAKVKLAMVERRAGRCDRAARLFEEATAVLPWSGDAPEAGWGARAYTGRALCALATGKPALEHAQRGFIKGNQDQGRFVLALAFYELGERETGHAMMRAATMLTDPLVKQALQAWLTGTGLTL